MERNVPEFETFADFLRDVRGARERRNFRFDREEFEEVGHEKRLVRDFREGGKDRLNVGTGSRDSARKQCHLAQGEHAAHRLQNHEGVGAVIARDTEQSQKRAHAEFPSRNMQRLVAQFRRHPRVTLHQERRQAEQLHFFRAFFCAADHSQVIELAARRCLLETHRIAQESEVRLAQKGGYHANEKGEQEPRSVKQNPGSQADGRDHFLHEPAADLDHLHAVGALHPRPLQLVVENRVFVRHEIQIRRVLHQAHADVAHEPLGESGVAKIHDPH